MNEIDIFKQWRMKPEEERRRLDPMGLMDMQLDVDRESAMKTFSGPQFQPGSSLGQFAPPDPFASRQAPKLEREPFNFDPNALQGPDLDRLQVSRPDPIQGQDYKFTPPVDGVTGAAPIKKSFEVYKPGDIIKDGAGNQLEIVQSHDKGVAVRYQDPRYTEPQIKFVPVKDIQEAPLEQRNILEGIKGPEDYSKLGAFSLRTQEAGGRILAPGGPERVLPTTDSDALDAVADTVGFLMGMTAAPADSVMGMIRGIGSHTAMGVAPQVAQRLGVSIPQVQSAVQSMVNIGLLRGTRTAAEGGSALDVAKDTGMGAILGLGGSVVSQATTPLVGKALAKRGAEQWQEFFEGVHKSGAFFSTLSAGEAALTGKPVKEILAAGVTGYAFGAGYGGLAGVGHVRRAVDITKLKKQGYQQLEDFSGLSKSKEYRQFAREFIGNDNAKYKDSGVWVKKNPNGTVDIAIENTPSEGRVVLENFVRMSKAHAKMRGKEMATENLQKMNIWKLLEDATQAARPAPGQAPVPTMGPVGTAPQAGAIAPIEPQLPIAPEIAPAATTQPPEVIELPGPTVKPLEVKPAKDRFVEVLKKELDFAGTVGPLVGDNEEVRGFIKDMQKAYTDNINTMPAEERTPERIEALAREFHQAAIDMANDGTEVIDEKVTGVAKDLRRAEMEASEYGKTIVQDIRKRGGIAPPRSDSFAGEYRESVPLTLKNKNGLPMDEMAEEMGLSVSDMLTAISEAPSAATKKVDDYKDEARRQIEESKRSVASTAPKDEKPVALAETTPKEPEKVYGKRSKFIQSDNNSPLLEKYGYTEDEGGETWLKKTMDKAKEEIAKIEKQKKPATYKEWKEDRQEPTFTRKVTANLDEDVLLSPKWVLKNTAGGLNYEHLALKEGLGKKKVARLTESIKSKGYDPEEAIFINIDVNGRAWINEGNHRLRAAIAAGVNKIPFEVRYFDGGERAEGPWKPDNLIETAEAAPAEPKESGTTKIVDKDGKPLTVYHGTTAPGIKAGDIDTPAYFSGSKKFAREFAEDDSNIIPVTLDIKNPYVFDEEGFKHKDGTLAKDEDGEPISIGFLAAHPGLVEELQERGFDGAIEEGGDFEFIVAFEPDQIRVAETAVTPEKAPVPKAPAEEAAPRVFFRGTTPGDTRRIDEPFTAAKGKTFMAKKEKSAKAYGGNVEKITAKPEAKILYEGTKDFGKITKRRGYDTELGLMNQLKKNETVIDAVNDAITKAEAAGYDAISFKRDSDIGSIILNEDAFIREGSKKGQHTEGVTRKGDFVYKPMKTAKGKPTSEAEIYKELRGVAGIAKGVVEGDKIKLPYYDTVLSIDTIPKAERGKYSQLVKDNMPRIEKAISELTRRNISYSDQLQFGVDKNDKLDLLDFSNAEKKTPGKFDDIEGDNRSLLTAFYNTFNVEGPKTYRYYTTQRPPGPGAVPAGAKYVESYDSKIKGAWGYVDYDKPLTPKQISDYELKPRSLKELPKKEVKKSVPTDEGRFTGNIRQKVSGISQHITKAAGKELPKGELAYRPAKTKDKNLQNAQKVGESAGYKVHLIEPVSSDYNLFNGVIVGDDIFLSTTGTNAPVAVMGHELLHGLKKNMPEVYSQALRLIEAVSNKLGPYKQKFSGLGLSDGQIMEELVGDYLGELMTYKKFWNALGDLLPKELKSQIESLTEKKPPSEFRVRYLIKNKDAVDNVLIGAFKTQLEKVVTLSDTKFSLNFGAEVSKEAEARGLSKDVKTQLQRGRTFYLKSERAIADKMPKQATASQVLSILRKNTKAEELKWLGIEDAIKRGLLDFDGKIRKEDVLSFIRANNIAIKEEVRSQERVEGLRGLEKHAIRRAGKIDKKIMEILAEHSVGNKMVHGLNISNTVNSGVMDGKDPADIIVDVEDYLMIKGIHGAEDAIRPLVYELAEIQEEYHIIRTDTDESRPVHGEWTLSGKSDGGYTELAFVWDNKSVSYRPPAIHHLPENTVLHTRIKTLFDKDGKKILFIEEIQSDWHQALRKALTAKEARFLELYEQDGVGVGITKEERTEYNKLREELRQEHGYLTTGELSGILKDKKQAPPDAPFKNSHEFGLKRLLRLAAENDYDMVSWTTGDQQAERYNLSSRVDMLRYDPKEESLVFTATGGGLKQIKEVKPKDLSQYVGDSVATALLETKPQNGLHTLENKDIKLVEKEGIHLKKIYDQMIPSFFNKYAKPWGAKTQVIKLHAEKRAFPKIIDEEWVDFAHKPDTKQLAIPITDKMKKSVLVDGQPLFQMQRGKKPEPTTKEGKARKRMFALSREMGLDRDMRISLAREFANKPKLESTTELNAEQLDKFGAFLFNIHKQNLAAALKSMGKSKKKKLTDKQMAEKMAKQEGAPYTIKDEAIKGAERDAQAAEDAHLKLSDAIKRQTEKGYKVVTEADVAKLTGEKGSNEKIVGWLWDDEIFVPRDKDIDEWSNKDKRLLSKEPNTLSRYFSAVYRQLPRPMTDEVVAGKQQTDLFVNKYAKIVDDALKGFSKEERHKVSAILDGLDEPSGKEGQAAKTLRKKFFDPLFEEAVKFEILTKEQYVEDYYSRIGETVNKKSVDGIKAPNAWFAHKRTGRREDYNKDVQDVALIYLNALSKNMFLKPLADKWAPVMRAMPVDRKKLAESMFGEALGRPQEQERLFNNLIKDTFALIGKDMEGKRAGRDISRLFISLASQRMMGFGVVTAMRNHTQKVLTIVEVASPSNPLRGFAYLTKAQRFLATKEGKEFVDKYNTLLKNRTYHDGMEEIYMYEAKLNKLLDKTSKVTMKMFKEADISNVKNAFLMGYFAARDDGMTIADALDKANDVVLRTQFPYDMRRANIYQGPIGKVAGLFTSWSGHYLELMADWGTSDMKWRAPMAMAIMAGITYLLGKLGIVIRTGFQDTVKSHILVKAFQGEDSMLRSYQRDFTRIAERLKSGDPEEWKKAGEDMLYQLPGGNAFRRVVRAVRAAGDDWQVRDERGRVNYQMSGPWEAIRSVLGETVESKDRWELTNEYTKLLRRNVDPAWYQVEGITVQSIEKLDARAKKASLDPQDLRKAATSNVRRTYYDNMERAFNKKSFKDMQEARKILEKLGAKETDMRTRYYKILEDAYKSGDKAKEKQAIDILKWLGATPEQIQSSLDRRTQ